jgi:AraC family transcriptional regulator of adaptative response/methylated-DNA-[protein]-cysteine methyltransferase
MLGVSPKEYVAARRVDRFKAAVRDGQDVTTALYDAGYGSSSRLYERSNAELGMTPGAYRDGGRDVRISFAVADTPLGALIVAATEKGLCAVRLGDSRDALVENLGREFPAAELVADDGELTSTIEQILAHISGGAPTPQLPLDVQATAFQRRVWEALQAIPRGETRTYRQVAEAIGQPAAARAVASACADNPVALVVPCHRVVRSDGGLGGYRWGIERKAEILRREGVPDQGSRA